LDDSTVLKSVRASYPDHPPALEPPRVVKGDEVSASNWWVGWRMNKTAEDWMRYWSGGKGTAVTTAMEDHGVLRSLQMLARGHLVDERRVLVLRTASNYSAPGKGQTAADLIAAESSDNSATQLSAYIPSLEAAYRVGSPVVDALSSHWDLYADHLPGVR
jgi:purine nucleoside permease